MPAFEKVQALEKVASTQWQHIALSTHVVINLLLSMFLEDFKVQTLGYSTALTQPSSYPGSYYGAFKSTVHHHHDTYFGGIV